MVLGIILLINIALGALGDEFQGGVTDRDRKAEGKVQHAALAAVLEPRTRKADVCFLVADCAVDAPPEDRERTRADLAFHSRLLFDHLDVGVAAETGFADGGEVGGFAAGAVDVGFWGHGSGGAVVMVEVVVMVMVRIGEAGGDEVEWRWGTLSALTGNG